MKMESPIFNPPFSSAAALKKGCRFKLKEIRQALPASRRLAAARSAYQTLLEKSCHKRWILSYASFGSELSLDALNSRLACEGRLVLPKMESSHLLLFAVENLNNLKINRWGIYEPCPIISPPIAPQSIQLAFIPGLGFDPLTKQRLGYGKGCYDRLLKQMTAALAWGVGFKEQGYSPLPCAAHDQPLDGHLLF